MKGNTLNSFGGNGRKFNEKSYLQVAIFPQNLLQCLILNGGMYESFLSNFFFPNHSNFQHKKSAENHCGSHSRISSAPSMQQSSHSKCGTFVLWLVHECLCRWDSWWLCSCLHSGMRSCLRYESDLDHGLDLRTRMDPRSGSGISSSCHFEFFLEKNSQRQQAAR